MCSSWEFSSGFSQRLCNVSLIFTLSCESIWSKRGNREFLMRNHYEIRCFFFIFENNMSNVNIFIEMKFENCKNGKLRQATISVKIFAADGWKPIIRLLNKSYFFTIISFFDT